MFDGTKVVNAKGEEFSLLQDIFPNTQAVAFYFAAHWCPDCRDFLPQLIDFYTQVNRHHDHQQQQPTLALASDRATKEKTKLKPLEIVFIGSDATREDQLTHFRYHQKEWLMLPFDDSLRAQLKRTHSICAAKEQNALGIANRLGGIPSLVLVNANGVATKEPSEFLAMVVEGKSHETFASWLALDS